MDNNQLIPFIEVGIGAKIKNESGNIWTKRKPLAPDSEGGYNASRHGWGGYFKPNDMVEVIDASK